MERKLNIGSTYQYMKHTMTVTRRHGNTLMAENRHAGYEVFRLTDSGGLPHEECRNHFWLELNAERCFAHMVKWHEPSIT